MGSPPFLTSGSFLLWSAGEEPFFITFCNQQIEYDGSGKTRGRRRTRAFLLRDCRSDLAIAGPSMIRTFELAKAVTFGLLVAVFRPVLSGERCHRLHVCLHKKEERHEGA